MSTYPDRLPAIDRETRIVMLMGAGIDRWRLDALSDTELEAIADRVLPIKHARQRGYHQGLRDPVRPRIAYSRAYGRWRVYLPSVDGWCVCDSWAEARIRAAMYADGWLQ